jgi:aspartate aminotransferase
MIRVSSAIGSLSASPTLAITAKAKQLKAQGIDVVAFGAGEPDFDTPDHIKDAAIAAIREGYTKYVVPSSGSPEIKDAIIDKFKRDNGLVYEREQIVVSCGAKHSLFNAFHGLLNPGDEAIIPAPYWVSYPEQVKSVGAEPVTVYTDATFKLDPGRLKAAITPKTKLLVLNSPSNPTGAVYSRAELESIAEVVLETGIAIISDEIYEKIIYDEARHVSIAALSDAMKTRTIVINGVSKSYAMTGWRIGYAAGPKEVMTALGRLQDQSTSNPTSISQKATIAALRGDQSCVQQMVTEFDARRKLITARASEIFGIKIQPPAGAFYLFVDVSGQFGRKHNGKEIRTASDFAEYLLEEAKVAVVPGEGFGAAQYIRFSYATSRELINKGMDRIEEAVKKLGKDTGT